jgi:PPOX class probable F420-dependent enzyme
MGAGCARLTTMDLDEARAIIREQSHAVLATRRSGDAPQMSPIIVAVDDNGKLMLSTRETAYKTKNLSRDPRASLCILPNEFYGRWVQVDTTAEIVHLPDAMDLLIDYYRRLSGEHPDWDDYRAAMVRDRRVMVLFTILHAGPDHAG